MTDRPIVRVELRSAYGRTRAYPANDAASHVTALTGSVTLRRADLATLIALGFSIVVASGETSRLAELE